MLKSAHATHAHGTLIMSGSLMFLDKFRNLSFYILGSRKLSQRGSSSDNVPLVDEGKREDPNDT